MRYFYLNLDEAIWKCSSETCLYPFENFRFKNFNENKVYVYEKIEDDPLSMHVEEIGVMPDMKVEESSSSSSVSTSSGSCAEYNIKPQVTAVEEFDFDAFTAEFFKTDSPAESQTSFEMKNDFDLMDGLQCPSEFKQDVVEQPIDMNGLNDILDDLINDNHSSAASTSSTVSPVQMSVAEPSYLPVAACTIDLEKEEALGAAKYVQMPKPKLSKCLKHIEAKIKMKFEAKIVEDPNGNSDAAYTSYVKRERKSVRPSNTRPNSIRPPPAKCKRKDILPIIRKSPVKTVNNDARLISLLSHKHSMKPLSFLQQLSSIDVSHAHLATLPSIGRPKIETMLQKELRLQRRSSSNGECTNKPQRVL